MLAASHRAAWERDRQRCIELSATRARLFKPPPSSCAPISSTANQEQDEDQGATAAAAVVPGVTVG